MVYQSKFSGEEIDTAIESISKKANTKDVEAAIKKLEEKIAELEALHDPKDPTEGVPEEEIEEPKDVEDLKPKLEENPTEQEPTE